MAVCPIIDRFTPTKEAKTAVRLSAAGRSPARVACSPAFFHNSSTRRFTSSCMVMTPGHGRVKPSPGHLRVASTPIFEP